MKSTNTHRRGLASATLVAALALTSCGGPSQRREPAAYIPPQGFAVLAHDATADDEIPSFVASRLRGGVRTSFSDADITAARRVLDRVPGWLLPRGHGEVCLARVTYALGPGIGGGALQPGLSVSCVSQQAARNGRLVEVQALVRSEQDRGRDEVLGVVPDGVRAVTIRRVGQRALTVPVDRNAFDTFARRPSRLIFSETHDGNRRVRSVELTSFRR